jgi:hypothetical protein
VLSALPVVSSGNLCCCLWIVLGGAVAAYLFQQNQPTTISAADGALVGLIAGFIGAFVALLMSIPITMLLAPVQQAMLERLAEGPNMPPELRRYIGDTAMSGVSIVVGFVVMLFVSPVFATLGGLLGAALFRKSTPPRPPETIDVPVPFTSQS